LTFLLLSMSDVTHRRNICIVQNINS